MNKLAILFLIFAVLSSIEAWTKIVYEDIRYLDFYHQHFTTGLKPVKQLECADYGNRLCVYYAPDYVRCINTGSNGGIVNWKCEAKLGRGITFRNQWVSENRLVLSRLIYSFTNLMIN